MSATTGCVVKITPAYRRSTQKRPHAAISELEESARNGKRSRTTRNNTRVEDLISSHEKTIKDLQKRVWLLEGGNSNRSVTSEPKEPEPEPELEPEPPYNCPLCGQSILHSHNLLRHLRKQHTLKDKLGQSCQICNRSFNRWCDFSRHMNTHYTGPDRRAFWDQYFRQASSGPQAESPKQLTPQPRRDLVDATPLDPQPLGNRLDAVPSNSQAEQIQQFSHWNTFNATPFDLEPKIQQPFSQGELNTFDTTPFDLQSKSIQQLFLQEDWNTFDATPFDFQPDSIQQLFSGGLRDEQSDTL
ncbi:hypothetical protein K432DRAFT_385500 [Lepidopterella palustris CBS 459.81]|uniref:C2H2-type domain-containing protein n=1 Tax=Lepidopterella palustris CBS 459.81 TaxID=1314670 RepID=A0A8E2E2W2_9PEZI|nr:hypothetical protein K432DRAFT_385500 [Lepidopterella palustris CBS 459.81]